MIEILDQLIDTISATIETLNNTCVRIDSIEFEDSLFSVYLGYAHYALGTPLYVLFTTVVLISLGVSLWSFILRFIMFLRQMLLP